MDDKVYTIETIQDTPFPSDSNNPTVNDTSGVGSGKQPSTNSTIPEQTLPNKKYSDELESQQLNTRTQKIISEFTFTPGGAIQIGDFIHAISGDIRISPNGMVARNFLGDTTFALDGDTGDLLIKGEVQAGSFISGELNIRNGGFISIGSNVGDTILDQNGIVSLNNFGVVSESAAVGITFSNTTYADRGALKGTTVRRPVKALITLSVVGSSEQINNTLDCNGRTYYRINSDRDGTLAEFFYDSFLNVTSGIRENIISKTYSITSNKTLTAGHHNISIQSKVALNTNFESVINQWDWAVIFLGS